MGIVRSWLGLSHMTNCVLELQVSQSSIFDININFRHSLFIQPQLLMLIPPSAHCPLKVPLKPKYSMIVPSDTSVLLFVGLHCE